MFLENANKSRRLMHTRSVECEGFLRDDGPIVAAMFPQFATKPAAKD
jgi:hypothetical protein